MSSPEEQARDRIERTLLSTDAADSRAAYLLAMRQSDNALNRSLTKIAELRQKYHDKIAEWRRYADEAEKRCHRAALVSEAADAALLKHSLKK